MSVPKSIALKVRKRDGLFCRGCGVPQSVNKYKIGYRLVETSFDLHHIHDPKDNAEINLITLCKYCHRFLHKLKRLDEGNYASTIQGIIDREIVLESRYCPTCFQILKV